jgi:prepilin-type N-terminal cleavage/methylation domain-containing protein
VKARRGFTLLEMLVATTILGVAVAGLLSQLSTSMRSAGRLIKEGAIETVVATGGPFMTLWWASRLRRDFPSLRIVQDFRDPWSDSPELKKLSPREQESARMLEREVLDTASAIVTVTEGLAAKLRAKTGTDVFVVPNGFDSEDFASAEVTMVSREKFVIMHAGNLTVGRQEPLGAFLCAVRATYEQMPELRLKFFGGYPWGAEDLIERGVLTYEPRVPAERISAEMLRAFGCLQLNARALPYLVSTKIYEYAYARRPVLSVNYGGEIDALVRAMHLGWSANADSIEAVREGLLEMYSTWRQNARTASNPKGLDAYDYASLSRQYKRVLFTSGD